MSGSRLPPCPEPASLGIVAIGAIGLLSAAATAIHRIASYKHNRPHTTEGDRQRGTGTLLGWLDRLLNEKRCQPQMALRDPVSPRGLFYFYALRDRDSGTKLISTRWLSAVAMRFSIASE